jgi:LuxR family maltose regulon positive regulatory protein
VNLEDTEQKHLTGRMCAIEAYASSQRGDLERGKELSQKALSLLPVDDRTRSWAAMNQAFSLRRSGDLSGAEQAFSEALAIIEEVGDEHNHLHALSGLATIQASRGRLHRAAGSYRAVLELADQYARQGLWFPITGDIHTALSTILAEWNELDEALQHARLGVEISERWGQLDFLLFSYRELAFILQAMGDANGATEVIQKMARFEKDLPEWPRCLVNSDKAELWLQQGEVEKASAWLQECGLGAADEITFHNAEVYVTVARILVACKRNAEAILLLEKLLAVAQPAGSIRRTLALLVMQVIALYGTGKPDSALAALEKALDMAEPEGFMRVFISNKELLEPLQQAAARRIHVAYVGKLLAAMKQPEAKPSVSLTSDGEWIEQLSKREVEILQLLATGISNEEIADTLVIAVVTVKKHLNNIYGKLNVHSRIAAVAKAQKLGII